MRTKKYLSIAMFFLLTVSIFSQSYTSNSILEFWVDIGEIAFIENDFDQDGKLDFLADANNQTQIIIGEISDNLINAKHKSQLFTDIKFIKYLDIDGDGVSELFVLDSERDSVFQLSTSTLETIKSTKLDLPSNYTLSDLIFASIDIESPKSWIAISTYNGAYELSPLDFSVIQSLPDALESLEIHIGNFDNDIENEICLVKNSNKIQILNSETFVIEHEISDLREDFIIADISNDGIIEIIILDYSDDVILYDYNKSSPKSILTDLPYGYSNLAVVDIDADQIPEIIMYDDDDSYNDLMIIKTFPLAINKIIDLPYNSQNYSGKLLGLDRFINPSANNLLFSGNTMSSTNYNTGIFDQATFSISNIAMTNFGHFTKTDEKQMVLSEIEASTGKGAISTSIINFETKSIEQTFYPIIVDPEKPLNPRMLGDIKNFRFPGDATSDLILKKSYFEELSFYSPKSKLVYNRDKFKFDDYRIHALNADGNPELINFDDSDNEITFYAYKDKFTWEQRLKVLSGSEVFHFFDIDNDLQKELIAISDNSLNVINTESGIVTSLSTDFPLYQVSDFTFFRDSNEKPMLALTGDSKLILYNMETESVVKEKEISGFFSTTIQALQMQEDGIVVTYILTDFDGLELYDIDLELVLKFPEHKQSWPNISKIQIHNPDTDNKPNLLVSYKYMVVDYNLDLPGEYVEYYHIINHYPQKNDLVNDKSSFFIQFDKSINTEELANNLKLIHEPDQSELAFTITTNDNYKFEIIPESLLTYGSSLKLSLSDELISQDNQFLTSSQIEDGNYIIPFHVKDKENVPSITLESENLNTLYNKSKRLIHFEGITNSNMSLLRSARVGYKDEEMLSILPKDGLFDETTESFECLIDGFNRNIGLNEFQIILDSYDGDSDTMTLDIVIVAEQGIPFKRNGVNNYNTHYQKRDSIGNKYEFAWSLNILHDDVFDENTVFGEGDYLYMRKNIDDSDEPTLYLHKIDKNDGTVIFKKEIGYDASSGNFVLDNGQIYLYMNEYGNRPMLKCIDTEAGDIIWESEFRNQHSEQYSPLVTDSHVLMSGGEYGGIYCFDRWTGQELWFHALEQSSDWSPSYYEGIVYTSAEGVITAFEVETGTKLWEKDLLDYPSFNNSSPIIDTLNKQLIYYTGEEIYALSLTDQTMNWTNPFSDFVATIAFSENSIYAKGQNTLYKIDASSGTTTNTKPSPNSTNEMFIAGNLVILNGNSGTYMYDRFTLAEKGSFQEKNYAMSIVDDMLLFSGVSELNAYKLLNECYDFPEFNEFICFGDNFILDEFTFEEAGTYVDTIISNTECDKIFTLNLTVSSQVTISDTLITSDDGGGNGSIAVFPTGGDAPYIYNWDNGKTTQLISGLNAGNYELTVTDENGCPFYFEFEVTLATSTQDNNFELSIYPSLLSGGASIFVNNLPFDWSKKVTLYNISNERIEEIKCDDNRILLPQNLSSGIYFIEFLDLNNSQSKMKRIVVF